MATPVEPFYEKLGHRIRSFRERKGLSQAQLAERLVPPRTRASIANIESAKQRVLSHMLVDIADALELPAAELLPPRTARTERPRPLAERVAVELAEQLGPEGGEALIAKLRASRRRAAS